MQLAPLRGMLTPKAAQIMLKTLLLVFACGLLFRELGLADSGLDSSCMLAQQDGLLKGTDFGRYLINTYGPLSFLISGLFHPRTYCLSIVFQVLTTLIALWPAVHLRWGSCFVLGTDALPRLQPAGLPP